MKFLFIKQQNKVLYFCLVLKRKINTPKSPTTAKKQNKLKVLCSFHSLPETYSSGSTILVLFQEQAMINKLACMKSVTLQIWKERNKLQGSLLG